VCALRVSGNEYGLMTVRLEKYRGNHLGLVGASDHPQAEDADQVDPIRLERGKSNKV
jgi:hypothetical protein